MINMLFYAIIAAATINFATGYIQLSAVNRTFELFYKGVLESSLAVVQDQETLILKFNKEKLIQKSEEYFSLNLNKYTTSYKTAYFFFEDDYDLCRDDNCSSVRVSLSCSLISFQTYNKALTFRISGGGIIDE